MNDSYDFEHLNVVVDGPLLWVEIDRPEVMNALHPPAHWELHYVFDAFAADPELRVAILTGAGPRSFCVGSEIKVRSVRNVDEYPPTGYAGFTARFDLDKPVIAAVNGLALGGGMEIVLACDMAFAAEHAEMALSEPKVGLAALGGGGLQRAARHLPLKVAMDLVLTARRISAREAKGLGLVNDVVSGDALRSRTRAVAMMIADNAPLAIQASKQVMIRSLTESDLDTDIRRRYPASEMMPGSQDAIEGQAALLEKRKPAWKGR